MAEIDYAFIADYARVDANGTLTAVGAGWTFLTTGQFPSVHRMSVAGRIRSRVGEDPVPVKITISGPDSVYTLAASADLAASEGARPYGDNRLGLLFALDVQVPLPKEGLYEIMIELVGIDAPKKRLAFEAGTD